MQMLAAVDSPGTRLPRKAGIRWKQDGKRRDALGEHVARVAAYGQWLRGPLRHTLEERLAPARVAHLGLFNFAATTRLMIEHLEGSRDHGKVLWALLIFDAWRARHLPGAQWS